MKRKNIPEIDVTQFALVSSQILNPAMTRNATSVHLSVVPTSKGKPKEVWVEEFYERGPSKVTGRIRLALHGGIVSRFKILGMLNIADHNNVRQGSFEHNLGGASRKVGVINMPKMVGKTRTEMIVLILN